MQWRRVWGRQWCVWGVMAFSAWLTPVHADVVIQGAGATFPSRVYDRWTARFMAERPGLSIRYQGTGSGDGIRQAKARTVHFGGTDNPLSAAQLAEHKLVQIPLLVGGFVPVVNLPGVKPNELVLSGEVLADMARGAIATWSDPRIAELNPGLRLPAMPVVRVVREDKSGSTEVWVRYLADSSPAFRVATLASDVYRKGDDSASLLNRPRPDAWPITSTSFVLLDARPKGMSEADWTARFVYWCFMHGDELTRGTGFAPLPATVQARLAGRLMQIRGPAGELTKFQ